MMNKVIFECVDPRLNSRIDEQWSRGDAVFRNAGSRVHAIEPIILEALRNSQYQTLAYAAHDDCVGVRMAGKRATQEIPYVDESLERISRLLRDTEPEQILQKLIIPQLGGYNFCDIFL